jgi:hypothetical protein
VGQVAVKFSHELLSDGFATSELTRARKTPPVPPA